MPLDSFSWVFIFPSKHALALVALDTYWQNLERKVLEPAFAHDLPPQERILRFFDLLFEGQAMLWQTRGYMLGCFIGNMTVELSGYDQEICDRSWASLLVLSGREPG